MTAVAKSSSTAKTPPARTSRFQPPDGAPLTPEQIEAKLVAAIQVSEDEQRDLIKQRAQAVQSVHPEKRKGRRRPPVYRHTQVCRRLRQRGDRVNLSLD